MYFKLKPKVGAHAETNEKGEVVTYQSKDGHVFDTDLNLVKMFPNKFERVEVGPDGTPPGQPKPSLEPEEKIPSKSKRVGRDVTKRFPKAIEEDFKVFSDGGAFFVAEADEPTKPLHDKPLHKKDVGPFIEKYLSE